ncbi:MAG: hypothetical protein JHC74_06410, partial [Thermoleophilia bacterium]|nr:hypothetical protein [Thermoleophilia bacterium]
MVRTTENPPPPPARLPPAAAIGRVLEGALRDRAPREMAGPGRRAAVLVV